MAGWRADKPVLIEGHVRQFEDSLPDILEGDGLPNVRVVDFRVQWAGDAPEAAFGPSR